MSTSDLCPITQGFFRRRKLKREKDGPDLTAVPDIAKSEELVQLTCVANCTDKLSIWYGGDMSNRLPPPQTERASALAAELRTIIGKLKRRLREHGSRGDLTLSQVSVILRLESEGSATASSLARAEGMRPQSMAAVIAPLETAGLVSGASDPSDGRQTLLSLSKTCQKWIRRGSSGATRLADRNDSVEALCSRAREARGSNRIACTTRRGLAHSFALSTYNRTLDLLAKRSA